MLSTVICNGLWIGLIKDNRDAHKSVLPESHDKNRNRHPTASVVLPWMYTVPQACTYSRQIACEVVRATYFSRACLGEVMKQKGSATVCGPRKKKKRHLRTSGCNPKHTLHYSRNSTICGVFWTAACLRMPSLNTRQGKGDRDELLHFVLLRPHDTT